MGVVPRRLVAWRDGPSRLWRSDPAYAPQRFLACKAQHLATGPLRHGDDYVLWGYGETGRSLRRALAAHGKRAAWIVEVHPRRLGKTIHGAKVVRPEQIPSLPRLPLIASVSGAPARAEIRAHCHRLGLREPLDFLCAAWTVRSDLASGVIRAVKLLRSVTRVSRVGRRLLLEQQGGDVVGVGAEGADAGVGAAAGAGFGDVDAGGGEAGVRGGEVGGAPGDAPEGIAVARGRRRAAAVRRSRR